jgi:hypothetical protein
VPDRAKNEFWVALFDGDPDRGGIEHAGGRLPVSAQAWVEDGVVRVLTAPIDWGVLDSPATHAALFPRSTGGEPMFKFDVATAAGVPFMRRGSRLSVKGLSMSGTVNVGSQN